MATKTKSINNMATETKLEPEETKLVPVPEVQELQTLVSSKKQLEDNIKSTKLEPEETKLVPVPEVQELQTLVSSKKQLEEKIKSEASRLEERIASLERELKELKALKKEIFGTDRPEGSVPKGLKTVKEIQVETETGSCMSLTGTYTELRDQVVELTGLSLPKIIWSANNSLLLAALTAKGYKVLSKNF